MAVSLSRIFGSLFYNMDEIDSAMADGIRWVPCLNYLNLKHRCDTVWGKVKGVPVPRHTWATVCRSQVFLYDFVQELCSCKSMGPGSTPTQGSQGSGNSAVHPPFRADQFNGYNLWRPGEGKLWQGKWYIELKKQCLHTRTPVALWSINYDMHPSHRRITVGDRHSDKADKTSSQPPSQQQNEVEVLS